MREGLLASEDADRFLSRRGEPFYSTELADAILTYLARSRARLMLVQLEDVVGESEQANLPGTTDAHPNWRRRLSRGLEETVAGADFRRVSALILNGRRQSARRSPLAREGSQHGLPKCLY